MTDVAQPTEAVRSSDHAREALLEVRRHHPTWGAKKL